MQPLDINFNDEELAVEFEPEERTDGRKRTLGLHLSLLVFGITLTNYLAFLMNALIDGPLFILIVTGIFIVLSSTNVYIIYRVRRLLFSKRKERIFGTVPIKIPVTRINLDLYEGKTTDRKPSPLRVIFPRREFQGFVLDPVPVRS